MFVTFNVEKETLEAQEIDIRVSTRIFPGVRALGVWPRAVVPGYTPQNKCWRLQ